MSSGKLQRDTVFDSVLEWLVQNWLLWVLLMAAGIILASAAEPVTLAWNRSPNPIVTGYAVYYGGAQGTCTNRVDAGNETNVTIAGLQPGITYYFTATSHDAVGNESPRADEVSYMAPIFLTASNTYASKVATNAPGWRTNRITGRVTPIPRVVTNEVFTGFWVSCPAGGKWTLQQSPDGWAWTKYASGTNAARVFVTNTGADQFLRLRKP